MSSTLQAVTPETFQQEVLEHKGTVVVDFWAPWCQPCKRLMPRIEKLAEENPNIKVVTVDCEAHRDWAKDQGIRSVPTLRGYTNGEKTHDISGEVVSIHLEKFFKPTNIG